MEFVRKRVLVVGLGKSGLSAARWFSGQGAEVTIGDVKAEADLDQGFLSESQKLGIKLETGGHREETFLDSDMIIVSPGVPFDIGPLRAARENDIPVLGEIELALGLVDIPIVAVTGTNGKTTTVSLLGDMIKGAGAKVFVGGNIGTPLMDYAAGEQDADYAVVEVSSFQLDTMDRFCPEVALLLNISPDHLDRYPDYETYVKSKLRIFQDQGQGQYAVLNDDDERLAQFCPPGPESVLRYGLEKRDNLHAYMEGDRLVACLPGKESHDFDIQRFKPPVRYNLENLMGVVLAGRSLDLEPSTIQDTINSFQGLPHRTELVGSINGVDFFNDSKATNVDSASRSISSFDRPVILIAGGRHKGGDYSPLVTAAKRKIKKVVLLGEARDLIAESFKGIIPFTLAENMEDAVSQAFSSAEPKDVVLLAPACSSFDMFVDYADRGRVFTELVERLNNGT